MAVLSEDLIEQLKDEFAKELKNDVEIEIFLDLEKAKSGDPNTDIEAFAYHFVEDFKKVTDKVKFTIYDVKDENVKNMIKERKLDIDKYGNRISPIITFKDYPNMIYLGFPVGEEFPILLEDIIHVSSKEVHLSSKTKENISKVNKPIDIYVFVTMTCPYCPYMTHSSHQFAMLNKNIRGIMILSEVFPEFAEKYNVYGVPHIEIIDNGKSLTSWEGMIDESLFSKKILEAIGASQ